MYSYDSIVKWQTNLNTVKVLKYTFLWRRYVNGQQVGKKNMSLHMSVYNMSWNQSAPETSLLLSWWVSLNELSRLFYIYIYICGCIYI